MYTDQGERLQCLSRLHSLKYFNLDRESQTIRKIFNLKRKLYLQDQNRRVGVLALPTVPQIRAQGSRSSYRLLCIIGYVLRTDPTRLHVGFME